jgi:ribosomal protein S6
MEETAKKDYEIAYLAKDENGADLVRQALVREGGEVFGENPAERIALAYKIGKESSAYFGWFHFRIAPEALSALQHELAVKSGIIRFLVVTPPFVKSKPKFVPKPKPSAVPAAEAEPKSVFPAPLSNEALERKIEEILQEQ